LTLEPTFGLTPNFAVGFMFLNAWQPGYTPQFAGWRLCRMFTCPNRGTCRYASDSSRSSRFQKTRYEQNSRRIELRPILDREFPRWQIVFNPVLERALRGPGTRHGWNFRARITLRWKREGFSPSAEYYGGIESITVSPRAQPQVHQLFLGGDWDVKPVSPSTWGWVSISEARVPE